jgi:hypothetical protein
MIKKSAPPALRDEPSAANGLRPRGSAFIHVLLILLAGMVVVAGMVIVVTAGFALSFDAIRAVGRASRIRPDWAWLLPAAIDGAMAVATVTVVVLRRLNRPTACPWTVVLTNATISVACNGLHALTGSSVSLPPAITMAVSAVPAVNLALTVHLLVVLIDALAEALKRSADTATHTTFVISQQEPQAEASAISRHGVDGSEYVPPDAGSQRTTSDEVDDLMAAPAAEAVREDGQECWGGQGIATKPVGRDLQRAAWRWAQDNRRADGSLPNGNAIGGAFQRSARWGRLVRSSGAAGELESG